MPKHNYFKIMEAATAVFGSKVRARVWMSTENDMLGGESPFDHARTESGAHKVLGILANMKDGLSY